MKKTLSTVLLVSASFSTQAFNDGVPEEHVAAITTAAGDFVHVRAPSGTAMVGEAFTAVGYSQFQSSEAGVLSGTVSAGTHCSSHFLVYHPEPFAGEHYAQVTCTVHEAGAITTRLEACTPQHCNEDTGTLSVN